LSPEMLSRAAEKPALRGRLTLADAAALPIADRTADLVLCCFAAGDLASLSAPLREMARAGKQGGRVIMSDLPPRAAAEGWKRSFRSGDSVFDIQTAAHSKSDFLAAAKGAELALDSEIEANFGAPELPVFRAAGKEDIFENVRR